MSQAAQLRDGLAALSIALPAAAQEKLVAYCALLAKWNKTYSLTALRDPQKAVSHHLLDSLAVLPHLPMSDGDAIADVGSGAGLPGIPLAIARREWRITLNDSSQKRAAFLRQAAIELGMRNVETYEGRVEAWRPAARFAVVISRAFSDLAEFIAKCRHLVAPGGVLAAMKGAAPAAQEAECRVVELKVPLLDARRHLVLCRVGG